MSSRFRFLVLGIFGILTVLSLWLAATRLSFTFDFERFFPEGDPDLEFFLDFRRKFEPDDNFLLLAVPSKDGVFKQDYLQRFDSLTVNIPREVPHLVSGMSLTRFMYPIYIPFFNSLTTIDAIHIDDPERYPSDSIRIMNDERMLNNLIDKKATTLVLLLKTIDNPQQGEAEAIVAGIRKQLEKYGFEEYHMLGRVNFQTEIVQISTREFILSSVISAILVAFIMFLIFRRWGGILVSLSSLLLGMILFVGFLALWGQQLDAIAALYPVIMIIVGTSDVVHLMTKYVHELKAGLDRQAALKKTMREIGLALFLTSFTTAIGFLSLMTSKIPPIRTFGIGACVGVIIAYLTVIFFTTAILTMFKSEQIIKWRDRGSFWDPILQKIEAATRLKGRMIFASTTLLIALCLWGISMISTNYKIGDTLPLRSKVTEDFRFFENKFSGFRPLELAIMVQGDYKADDFVILQDMDRLEQHLRSYPSILSVNSTTTIYKSINRAFGGDNVLNYKMPQDTAVFNKYKVFAEKFQEQAGNVLVSKDGKNARISARILDIGGDSIQQIITETDRWIAQNIDSTHMKIRQTGTGVIVDKNSQYVRDSLLQGLGIAVALICLLMAIIFKNWKMFLISIIPNLIPLFISGALLGFLGIELEAGTAIIFAIVFGIAVDDTIHFLSKYRICRYDGMGIEQAISTTFKESGQAMILTSLILFFGFLVLLFSSHPPSITIGLLISVTLFTALLADLYLIAPLIRFFYKKELLEEQQKTNS